jgi:O-antigen/teichoic acid export membrane protein
LLTLSDQFVLSAANFMLSVLIARAGGTEGLGTLGIAFLIWLAVLGTNRALVTEPMTVCKPSEGRQAQLPEGLLAALVIGVVAAVLVAGAGLVLALSGVGAVALLALAPCLPSLLAHDYCRGTAFRLHRPERALLGDVGFAAVQGVGSFALLVLDVSNVAAFMAVWGLGATAGAAIGIGLNRIRPVVRGGVALLRELWSRSRWFLAEFGTAFPADQGSLLLLPVLLGTGQFGLYRAGTGLIGPIVVILIVGGNLGLPESVRRLRQDGVPGLASYAPRLTAAIVAVTVLYCSVVVVFAEQLLRLIYGEQFTGAATITRLIAVQYVLLALSSGFGQAAKAAGGMRQLWAARVVSAAVSVTAMVVLVEDFGLVGAGLASVTAGGAFSLGVLVVYRRAIGSRRATADSQPVEPGSDLGSTQARVTIADH